MLGNNEKHFSKVLTSIACVDKMRQNLETNRIRDKVLNGTMSRDDCDNENVFEFWKPLKQNGRVQPDNNNMIDKQEWKEEVKNPKKRSVSSVYSKRDCAG